MKIVFQKIENLLILVKVIFQVIVQFQICKNK